MEVTWTLISGRKSIAIQRGGESHEFHYDIVEMKLLAEELERKHGLRVDETTRVAAPNIPFLRDLAASLEQLGMGPCTSDAAWQFYNLVNTQFLVMSLAMEDHIKAMAKG